MSESVAADQLRAFVERLERMHEERKSIADGISEIYAEAKGTGFDVPTLKKLLKIRATDLNERLEQEALLDLYMSALGMQVAPVEDEPPARARAPAREIIEEFDHQSHPVAKVDEEANGPRVAASDDPASRGDEEGERQLLSSPGLTAAPNSETPWRVAPSKPEGEQSPSASAPVYQFRPKPHDGPVNSRGGLCPMGCLNIEACAGKWDQRCFTCERAWNDGAASDGAAA